ncbi:hypothetical protein DFH08DRAFT_800026 [Mycena albidolilacea]|uniref:Uncharacterized protein n=1 Tax=Mycena albidolilacea TaxID=1033008 RepID=A0AAD7F1J4_9AGAR|nr:hypothetical protein DFH08DRAFT_800026 [Mycena albidolilacea]
MHKSLAEQPLIRIIGSDDETITWTSRRPQQLRFSSTHNMSTTFVGKIELHTRIIPRLDLPTSPAHPRPRMAPATRFFLTLSPGPSSPPRECYATGQSVGPRRRASPSNAFAVCPPSPAPHSSPIYPCPTLQTVQPRVTSQVWSATSGNNQPERRLVVWISDRSMRGSQTSGRHCDPCVFVLAHGMRLQTGGTPIRCRWSMSSSGTVHQTRSAAVRVRARHVATL